MLEESIFFLVKEKESYEKNYNKNIFIDKDNFNLVNYSKSKIVHNENKINTMIVLILAVQVFLNCKKRCSSAIDATRQYIGTTNKNNLILS